ncbi:MAG: hypothetical protein ACKVP2_03940, partial [Burkholderiales bacterium]
MADGESIYADPQDMPQHLEQTNRAWLGPDAKSQVTFRYEDGWPVAVEAVVLSTQHDATVGIEELRAAVRREIIDPVIPVSLR